MANKEWLYSTEDDEQQGPVSAKELQQLAKNGELSADDLVWKEGMDEWAPASKIKGLTFVEPPVAQTAPVAQSRFNAESLQSTLRTAQDKADEAAGFFWYLDLKFSRFVSANIIRVIWTVYLVLVVLSFVLGVLGAVLNYPIIQAVFGIVLASIGYVFFTLMLRVWLEVFMVVFRIAEHMREMNSKLSSK